MTLKIAIRQTIGIAILCWGLSKCYASLLGDMYMPAKYAIDCPVFTIWAGIILCIIGALLIGLREDSDEN